MELGAAQSASSARATEMAVGTPSVACSRELRYDSSTSTFSATSVMSDDDARFRNDVVGARIAAGNNAPTPVGRIFDARMGITTASFERVFF